MPQAAMKRTDPTWQTLDKAGDGASRAETPKTVGQVPGAPAADARGLQEGLQRRLMIKDPSASRWSARRTLVFVLVSSLLLWSGIVWGGFEVAARLAG